MADLLEDILQPAAAVEFGENPAVAGSVPSTHASCRTSRWRPVSFRRDLQVVGGYHQKALSIEAVDQRSLDGSVNRTFIKIKKESDWLTKLVTGAGTARHGELKRCKVVDDIFAQLALFEVSGHSTEPEHVASTQLDSDAEKDPMLGMEELPPSPKRKGSRTVRKTKPKRTKRDVPWVALSMPSRCAAANPSATALTTITVLRERANKKGGFRIEAKDLSWLVLYLADEYATARVSVVPAVAGAHDVPNCTVPWLHMRRNLSAKVASPTFLAKFTAGPCKDSSEIRSSSAELTEEKWTQVIENAGDWSAPTSQFNEASQEERTRVTARWLEMGCARILLKALELDFNCVNPIKVCVDATSGAKGGY